MHDRIEVLAFLQRTAAAMHGMAHDNLEAVSPELRRIADELAREAAQLEADMLHDGLLTWKPANLN